MTEVKQKQKQKRKQFDDNNKNAEINKPAAQITPLLAFKKHQFAHIPTLPACGRNPDAGPGWKSSIWGENWEAERFMLGEALRIWFSKLPGGM